MYVYIGVKLYGEINWYRKWIRICTIHNVQNMVHSIVNSVNLYYIYNINIYALGTQE